MLGFEISDSVISKNAVAGLKTTPVDTTLVATELAVCGGEKVTFDLSGTRQAFLSPCTPREFSHHATECRPRRLTMRPAL